MVVGDLPYLRGYMTQQPKSTAGWPQIHVRLRGAKKEIKMEDHDESMQSTGVLLLEAIIMHCTYF